MGFYITNIIQQNIWMCLKIRLSQIYNTFQWESDAKASNLCTLLFSYKHIQEIKCVEYIG